ncbi:hypothetical protein B4090_2160 [Bacillus licheniformis]|nr:hypothetical protein B4090_2160 [Bacillus licheniformis]KYD01354.1 hypothetical protein B4164_2037 [Bacillus licheniformis]TWJ54918.1 hypothetical protein CHCC5024_2266 [Bacillus licheniformis]TWJ89169.1 hypothetical protein CHCC20495_4126 [Bacillus licheniformis]TWK02102.1 hypothetical protein CHCC20442_3381 [Bacillus licheniformis]
MKSNSTPLIIQYLGASPHVYQAVSMLRKRACRINLKQHDVTFL